MSAMTYGEILENDKELKAHRNRIEAGQKALKKRLLVRRRRELSGSKMQ